MRNGIQSGVQAGYIDIQIEGENRVLIQAVQGRIHTPWEIQILVQDIATFFTRCNTVITNHIYREGNRVVDWLAKYGLSCHSSFVWNLIPHRDLGCILLEDNLG